MAQENQNLERIVGKITNPGKFKEIIFESTEDGTGTVVYGVPKPKSFSTAAGITRRAFTIGVPAAALAAYFGFGINKQLGAVGKMVDSGYEFSQNIVRINADTFRAFTGQLELDKIVKELSSQDAAQEEKVKQLYEQFLTAYNDEHSIAASAKKVSDKYGGFSKSLNDALRGTPVGGVETNPAYGARERVQDWIQGLLGRNTSDPKYAENFRNALDKRLEVETAITAMEVEIEKAIKAGDLAKAQKMMSDYTSVVQARKDSLDKLSPEKLDKLQNDYFAQLEKKLSEETGGAFGEYAQIGKASGMNFSFWFPTAGAILAVTAGYTIAKNVEPVFGIADIIAGAADRMSSARVSRRQLLTLGMGGKTEPKSEKYTGGNEK